MTRLPRLTLLALALAAAPACRKTDETRERASQEATKLREGAEATGERAKEGLDETAERARERAGETADRPRDDQPGPSGTAAQPGTTGTTGTADQPGRTDEMGKPADQPAAGTADQSFEAKRSQEIQKLRSRLELAMLNGRIVATLASAQPLTEEGRSNVAEKLTVIQMRVTEAGNALQGLDQVPQDQWEDRFKAANDATSGAETAVQATVDALRDAPRSTTPPVS